MPDEFVDRVNRSMIAFDLALGTAALLAPRTTLRALGHAPPSADAQALLRRCGPIWLTFAAAHAVAERRGEGRDWWALAWLRGTELFTDAVWARSGGFSRRPDARAVLTLAGAANAAMAIAFGRRGRAVAS
jgi:hypothetical protein